MMKVVCAWCGQTIKDGPLYPDGSPSHGICVKCVYVMELKEMDDDAFLVEEGRIGKMISSVFGETWLPGEASKKLRIASELSELQKLYFAERERRRMVLLENDLKKIDEESEESEE